MTTFLEFMKRCQSQRLLEGEPGLPESMTIVASASFDKKAVIYGTKREKKLDNFRELAKETVSDEAFLSEFSEGIGEPRETETEDEFVSRAKDHLTSMLKSRLKVK